MKKVIITSMLMVAMCIKAEGFDEAIYFDQIVEHNDFINFKKMSNEYRKSITPEIKAHALSISVYSAKRKDTYQFTTYLVEELNADINMTYDDIKFTPFHKAVLGGDIKTIKFLLSKGAKVNVRNSNDFTPLMGACGTGNKEAVILILGKNADYKFKDVNGKTAMQYAKDGGHQDIVDILIKAGAKE